MGIFRQFPYSNFHDMNMDTVLRIMREMQDEWAATKTEWASYKEYIDNYFTNLDVSEEVLAAMRVFAADGTLNSILEPQIANEVSTWLAAHITLPEGVVIDDTLTIAGAAADAFAAGNIKRGTEDLYDELEYTLVEGEYVDREDGHFAYQSTWSRTSYIPVDPTKTLHYYGPSGTYNAWYDENHNFIRALTLTAGHNVLVPNNDFRYVVFSQRTDKFPLQVWTEKITNIENKLESLRDGNLTPNTGWICGRVDETGQVVLAGTRLVSDFIPAQGETSYKAEVHKNLSPLVASISEYDENKNFLYASPYMHNDRIYITDPRTRYIRMMLVNDNDDTILLVPEDGSSVGLVFKPEPIPHMLKVMSYNLGHYHYGVGWGIPEEVFDEKLANYRKFFGDQKLDVLGAQEYDSRIDAEETIWAHDILWDHYFPYNKHTGAQTAVLTNHFIDYTYNKQLSSGKYYTEALYYGIYLISVHLTVGEGNEATRLQEAAEIVQICQQHDKYIIFGDFNAEPGEEDDLYAVFTEAGMKLANCGWFGKFYTWSNNYDDYNHYDNPTGTKLYYIDNVICSPNMEIYDAYPVPEAYAQLTSDHIPFVAYVRTSNN